MPNQSERVACNVCDTPMRPVRIQDGHRMYGASGCRGQLQINVEDAPSHVQKVYSDEYFIAGGAGYNDYVKDGFVIEAHGRRYGRILRRYLPRHSRVLDVGAAAGFIAAGIGSVGLQVTGVEPNETMARYARSHLDVDVHGGPLESFVPQEPLDAVCFVQVLEHLKSPRDEVSRLAARLEPGGLVLVETWDMDSIPAKVLGPRWHQYSPPSVVHWFSAATLRSMFRSLGFELVVSGRPLKFITLRHGLSLLAHKFPGLRFIASMAEGPIGRTRIPYPPLDLRWFVFRKTRKNEV